MNVTSLLRSMIGDLQTADAKTLELKVGQIVKGIVLQLLSEQEALININGVQLRARLETPLKQGDSTLLQVQPESVNGQPVLKPLQDVNMQIADASFPALLKELGQKDTTGTRQLVLTMQREGVPLTKETVASFVDAVKTKPAKLSADDWTQTAALAFKRGLPLTGETLGALHHTLSGPPLYELVQRLGAEARAQLQSSALPPAVRQLLEQLADTARQALGHAADAYSSGGVNEALRALPQAAAPGTATGQGRAGTPPARTRAEPLAAAAQLRAAAVPVPAAAAPAPQAQAEGAASTAAAPGSAAAAAPEAAGAPPPERAAQPQQPARAAGDAAARGEGDPGHWIGRLLKALGVEHERELQRLPEKPEPLLHKLPDGTLGPSADGAGDSAETVRLTGSDTLKSLLLQLVSSNDVPAALKDTMQQTLQQITGQQLLLAPDHNAPFAQVTLFVPLRGADGEQTASVHIQSRRGTRGQLDASNCRLLFDLHLKQMGNTLLDVQIVDRRVSLNVRNDHSAVPKLIDSYREEIALSLKGAGYELLTLRFGEYPTPAVYKETSADDPQQSSHAAHPQLKTLMQAKPYRGVDFRA